MASYRIPTYEYEQRIDGQIKGVRQVQMNDGELAAFVVRVKPGNGPDMNVLLGTAEDLQSQDATIRPGSQIRVNGYKREVDGKSTFVVQDVAVQSSDSERQASSDDENGNQSG